MFRFTFALLCAVLVLSNVDLIYGRKFGGGGGRRTGSHSYPSSGGLSGGGSHSYPSSGGLSGGGSHGYPSGGVSGGGSHGYPSGGLSGSGSHGYPASGGVSGGGRGGYPGGGSGSHSYPNAGGGSHGYPSGGNSGGHGYPASPGLSGSGSNSHGYPANKGNYPSGTTTNVHHHYHYSPPQQISYASPRGGPAMTYPVYRGTPPTYVYQYKDSGSKYGTLLAGLALMNLGVLGAGIYASSHSHSNNNNYKSQPGEVCKFGLKKENGDYEETRIDCQLITSFIFAEQAKTQNQPTNTSVVTTTVTNTTIVNTTNPAPDAPQTPGNVTVNVTYTMMPDGTLVPVNMSSNGTVNVTTEVPPAPAAGGSSSSVVVTTTTNTTVVNALDVKGKPVEVTPGMECYVMRKTSSSNMRKSVPCGLLQTYAEKSIKANSAARNVPAFTLLAVVCAVFVMN